MCLLKEQTQLVNMMEVDAVQDFKRSKVEKITS